MNWQTIKTTKILAKIEKNLAESGSDEDDTTFREYEAKMKKILADLRLQENKVKVNADADALANMQLFVRETLFDLQKQEMPSFNDIQSLDDNSELEHLETLLTTSNLMGTFDNDLEQIDNLFESAIDELRITNLVGKEICT